MSKLTEIQARTKIADHLEKVATRMLCNKDKLMREANEIGQKVDEILEDISNLRNITDAVE